MGYPLVVAMSRGLPSWLNLHARFTHSTARPTTATAWRTDDINSQDLAPPIDLSTAVEFAWTTSVGIFNYVNQTFSGVGAVTEKAALQFCRADMGHENDWKNQANWRYLDTGTTVCGVFIAMGTGGLKRLDPTFIHHDARRLVVLRLVTLDSDNANVSMVTGLTFAGFWE